MTEPSRTRAFDESAATWDDNPHRIALMKAVGETILREAKPTSDMEVLDYGCGTGLVGLYLLAHVRSVTGADNSTGMLQVLGEKITRGGLTHMQALKLDLEHDPVPPARYHMIVVCMALHHIAALDRVLGAFYEMLCPGGRLCIADLDTEPGVFHDAATGASVFHHGFDRAELKARLARIGFRDLGDVTAHTVYKPVNGGPPRGFPVFLIAGRR
jgi:ubiquinone/menaquinone biosynthesis C-methylase UbiE